MAPKAAEKATTVPASPRSVAKKKAGGWAPYRGGSSSSWEEKTAGTEKKTAGAQGETPSVRPVSPPPLSPVPSSPTVAPPPTLPAASKAKEVLAAPKAKKDTPSAPPPLLRLWGWSMGRGDTRPFSSSPWGRGRLWRSLWGAIPGTAIGFTSRGTRWWWPVRRGAGEGVSTWPPCPRGGTLGFP